MDYTKQDVGNTLTPTPRRPEMAEIIDCINQQLSRWEGNTVELNGKIQKIKNYDEPKDSVKPEAQKSPTCVIDELFRIHQVMQDYNTRLEFSCRHLSEIV